MPSWNIRCVLRSRLKLVSMERKMMMLMWSRKMLILRRKTDEARTQTYTLCEPAQSKCTSTCHKSRTIRKFTGNTPQTRVRSTQIRHLPLHLAKEPLSVDKLFGESKDRLQLPASVLDLSLARAHGHPGTTRSTGTRAQGHTGTTPIQGHTGTRARTTRGPCSNFVTRSLSHTTFTRAPSFTHNFVTQTMFLCHTPCFTLTHTTLFYFSILHHLLCLSFLPRPRYNIWCSLFFQNLDLGIHRDAVVICGACSAATIRGCALHSAILTSPERVLAGTGTTFRGQALRSIYGPYGCNMFDSIVNVFDICEALCKR